MLHTFKSYSLSAVFYKLTCILMVGRILIMVSDTIVMSSNLVGSKKTLNAAFFILHVKSK
jgi:hypothetical protein